MTEAKRPIPRWECSRPSAKNSRASWPGGSRSHDPHAEQAGCIPLLVGLVVAAIMLFTLGGFGCWLSGVL